MLFKIHAAMQDADNFNLIFSFMTIKDQMLANTIFVIAFTYIIACAPYIWSVGKIMKGCVELTQIALLLRLSPLRPGITAYREYIGSCLLGEGE